MRFVQLASVLGRWGTPHTRNWNMVDLTHLQDQKVVHAILQACLYIEQNIDNTQEVINDIHKGGSGLRVHDTPT